MSSSTTFKRWAAYIITHWILILAVTSSFFFYYKEHQDHLRTAREFNESTYSAQAGRWFWDLESEAKGMPSLHWDKQMFVVFDIKPENWRSDYHGFEDCIVEEDRNFVRDKVHEAIRTRGSFRSAFRITDSTGTKRYIMASGTVSGDGKYMTGLNIPISGEVMERLYEILPPLERIWVPEKVEKSASVK